MAGTCGRDPVIVPTVAQQRRARLGRAAAVAAVAVVGVLAAGSVVAGRWALSSATTTPVEGTSVPDAVLERLDGGTVDLAAWRGRPVVVHFWTSWCSPCVADMVEVFEPFHRQSGEHVAVVGVNLQETGELGRAIATETGVTYDLLRDPGGEAFDAVDAVSMPTTVVIDAAGDVVARHTGPLAPRDLERLVREHLPTVPAPGAG